MRIDEVKLENVVSVYSGRVNACCCGCAGKHTYATAHRDFGGESRGYPVKDDEVSDRGVKTIFKKMAELGARDVTAFDDGMAVLTVDTETRTYIMNVKV